MTITDVFWPTFERRYCIECDDLHPRLCWWGMRFAWLGHPRPYWLRPLGLSSGRLAWLLGPIDGEIRIIGEGVVERRSP